MALNSRVLEIEENSMGVLSNYSVKTQLCEFGDIRGINKETRETGTPDHEQRKTDES